MKRILPILFLIKLTFSTGYIMASHQGVSPFEPPDPSDSSFLLDVGPIEAIGAREDLCASPFKTDQCTPLAPGGSITFTIPVRSRCGRGPAEWHAGEPQ